MLLSKHQHGYQRSLIILRINVGEGLHVTQVLNNILIIDQVFDSLEARPFAIIRSLAAIPYLSRVFGRAGCWQGFGRMAPKGRREIQKFHIMVNTVYQVLQKGNFVCLLINKHSYYFLHRVIQFVKLFVFQKLCGY